MELLIVMGIIGVLMGIFLPVLSQARSQARMLNELSAGRQLISAYTLYLTENRGALIPGHIVDRNLSILDDRGKPLTGEPVKRWPWRLASHIKFGLYGSVLVNEQADNLRDRNAYLWSYLVSLNPSLGLNYLALGGDVTMPTVTPGVPAVAGAIPVVTPTWAVRRAVKSRNSDRLIVFASSRGPGLESQVEGYFRITPPKAPNEYAATGWSAANWDAQTDPAAWGYVHPRWKNRAVVACLDGHTELLTLKELRDMTRWVPDAAANGNPDWVPPVSVIPLP